MKGFVIIISSEPLKKRAATFSQQLRGYGFKTWSEDDLIPSDDWDLEIPRMAIKATAVIFLTRCGEFEDFYLRSTLAITRSKNTPEKHLIIGDGSVGNEDLEASIAWLEGL